MDPYRDPDSTGYVGKFMDLVNDFTPNNYITGTA